MVVVHSVNHEVTMSGTKKVRVPLPVSHSGSKLLNMFTFCMLLTYYLQKVNRFKSFFASVIVFEKKNDRMTSICFFTFICSKIYRKKYGEFPSSQAVLLWHA